MTTDDLGTRGFAHGTDRYERARPSYSHEVVEHLCAGAGIGPGTRVLDLAAGTGKLTRLLVERGASVTAVEPSAAMRETFARVVEGVPVYAGTAERIPAPAGAYDVVTVAQAFHWFDPEQALREIARVLRPGGALAMVWNELDESEEFIAHLHRVAEWPFHALHDYRAELDGSDRFEPAERTLFPWRDELTRDQVVERCSTFSYVAAGLAVEPRARFLSRVREFLGEYAEPIELAYITDTYIARRRDFEPPL
ncbi:class I SAM-dependent methyltransferase [Embleya sp. NPDC050493]|uniref:class I SAM-dependent methyltransferase n=1 Tax=Embleya sp. NPDC050493 TaxID=3363989 RepID=UPI0037888FCF